MATHRDDEQLESQFLKSAYFTFDLKTGTETRITNAMRIFSSTDGLTESWKDRVLS
jgi:hypothetical protein